MTSRAMIEFLSKSSARVIDARFNFRLCRVLDRFEMWVDVLDKSVTPHLINDGFWESWITKWVIDNVDDNTVFIDIGSNTGYYAFLAHYLGADVSAFEPNPDYANLIRHSQGSNKMQFPVNEYALSNYNGEAKFNIPIELHGSASLSQIIEGYETRQIEVLVRELDWWMPGNFKDGKKLVVKIDAEGEEERVLQGGKKFLDSADEVVLLLEYTPGAYSADFVDHLFDNYDVAYVDGNGNEERAFIPWLEAQTDWVMLVLR